MNRIRDFAPGDEKEKQLKITSDGSVRYVRAFRMRSSLSPKINAYPYDIQIASVTLSSGDYSTSKLELNTTSWDNLVKKDSGAKTSGWLTNQTAIKTLQYKYFDRNTEWDFIAYSQGLILLADTLLLRYVRYVTPIKCKPL